MFMSQKLVSLHIIQVVLEYLGPHRLAGSLKSSAANGLGITIKAMSSNSLGKTKDGSRKTLKLKPK